MRGEPWGAAVRAGCERAGCARELPAGGSVELWKAGSLARKGLLGEAEPSLGDQLQPFLTLQLLFQSPRGWRRRGSNSVVWPLPLSPMSSSLAS